jgi:hypothetical protein
MDGITVLNLQLYLSRFFPDLLDILGIPINDNVLCIDKPATPTNKDFRSSTNTFPKSAFFYNAGSNSTGNLLRYLTINSAVATASGEPELNVAMLMDYQLILKRVRYIVGSNTKNAVTNISFRKDLADLVGTTLAINPAQNMEFDSGILDVDISIGSRIDWKWDTSLSASGSITIVFYAYFESALK